MRKIIIALLASSLGFFAIGQEQISRKTIQADSKQYDEAKMNGTLDLYNIDPSINHQSFDVSGIETKGFGKKKPTQTIPEKASGCNCYEEPDSTYLLALAAGDDGSSSAITIPFPFCFYGDTMTTMYINNNGNITFVNPMSTFSSTAFPSTGPKIIAPFWADVDTRNGNGQVRYKVTPTAIYINWYHVGYYAQQGDKLNNFQLIITNGADPVIDGGNVAFCYEDMQWTTGSASQGVNGFGGTPATAGANKGNGTNFFLIARFDHPGTDFDGALGDPDGISWLDNKSFFFDVCSYINIPPVPNGASSCDTFRICSIGDTADIQFLFLSPEATQSTSITVSAPTLPNLQVVSNVPGNTAYTVLRVPGDLAYADTHTVQITATDNGTPTGITTLYLTVIIDSSGTANFNPSLSPVNGCDSILVNVLNGPYDSYLWDNLLLDSSIWITSAQQNYGVTVSKNGCYKRVDTNFLVMPSFDINLAGNDSICLGVPDTYIWMPDSTSYGDVSWGLSNIGLDSLYSNTLVPGIYSISVSDSAGICTMVTTLEIITIPKVILQPDDSICGTSYIFSNNTGGSGPGTGIWTWVSTAGTPIFNDNTSLNPTVTFNNSGVYDLIYTNPICADDDTVTITVSILTSLNLLGNDSICPGISTSHYVLPDSAFYGTVSWGLANPALDSLFSNDLTPGTYSVTMLDPVGICALDTTFTIIAIPPVVLQPDDAICGTIYSFTSNTGGSGPGTGAWSWTSVGGNPQFINQTLNPTVIMSNTGVYNLIYTNSVCNDDDTVTITTSKPFTALSQVSGNKYFCPGQPGATISILNPTRWGTINWGNPNAVNNVPSQVLVPGNYTVTLVDTLGLCSSSTSFVISTQPDVVLMQDTVICIDHFTMTQNTGGDATTGGTWSLVSGPGTPTFGNATGVNALNTSVTFPTYGIYTLKYTDNHCPDSDELVVNYSAPPVINFNNIDYFVCPGTTESIKLIDSLNLFGAIWNGGSQVGFHANLAEGTHTVVVANLNGCLSDSTFLITTQALTDLLDHPNACGDVITLNGNVGLDNGLWTQISGPGTVTFEPVDSIQTVATWPVEGTYTIAYTEPVCQQPATLVIDVTFYPYSEVPNVIGCLGIAETLTAYSIWNNVTTYEWSDGQTGPTASFVNPGTYYLNSTNSCGTHTWDFVYEAHVCDIEMPNVFTPNGDLINGLYGPIGADAFGFKSFNCKIFNRWGNLMYQFNDITKGWDGKSTGGQTAEDGVYFYKVEATDVDGKPLDKQGFFHLISK